MATMRLSRRLLGMANDLLHLGVTLAEDALDEWMTGESRQALLERVRAAANRGAELALENARLKDEVDRLRFNGPTLFRDEVEVLRCVTNAIQPHSQSEDTDEWIRGTVAKLLNRCDHMPMTANELDKQIDDVISGRVATLTWEEAFGPDDSGAEVDIDPRNWDFSDVEIKVSK